MSKNIAVAGIGYVGLNIGLLLSQKNNVTMVDINEDKVEKINNKISPLEEVDTQNFIKRTDIHISATTNTEVYKEAEVVFIATPTDFDEITNKFNTRSIENVVESVLSRNKKAMIVIKSTIPVGYTESLRAKYKYNNIYFSPEFLREGRALYDTLNPSRVIVGCNTYKREELEKANEIANLLIEDSLIPETHINKKIIGLEEAESVKLFSNAYLAMRVAFFNELDTFAETLHLDSGDIIDGVIADERIGNNYCNPSFGYGGYCFPKDTKQLRSAFNTFNIHPSNLINAIVESNENRKHYIAQEISDFLSETKQKLGFFRINMKTGSDNFRSSALLDILKYLSEFKDRIIIYEPLLGDNTEFMGMKVVNDLEKFKETCDTIVTNRMTHKLSNFNGQIYTRDIYNEN